MKKTSLFLVALNFIVLTIFGEIPSFADRLLCSRPVLIGKPETISPKAGAILLRGNKIRFTPSATPETVSISLPLLAEKDNDASKFRIYSEFEMEITARNENTLLSVDIQTAWPFHGSARKSQFRLKQGKHRHKFYIHLAGYRTQFQKIVLTLHHSPDAPETKDRSTLNSDIVFEGFCLNALESSLKLLDEKTREILASPLPEGFSSEAVNAAKAKRQKLSDQCDHLLDILKNKSTTSGKNAISLDRLYDLRNTGRWAVQLAALQNESVNGPIYAWCGGTDKILQNDLFPGYIGGTARVDMARNETEGLQIAIFSPEDLDNVSVHLGEFVSDDGTTFPGEHIVAAPIGYITASPPAYFSSFINHRIPDPILEYLKEFPVEKERFQPIWVDVHASKSQSPGIYSGGVDFRSKGKTILHVPMTIEVRNFELPDRMTFPAIISSGEFYHGLYEQDGNVRKEFMDFLFSENGGDATNLSPAAQRAVKINNNFFSMLRKHRIQFHDIYRSTRKIIPSWRRKIINEYNTLYCLGYDNDGNVMKHFEKQFAEMRQEGTADRAFIYGYDEIRSSDKKAFESMKKSYGNLKAKFPELTTMATALDYSLGEKTNIQNELDVWIIPPNNFMGAGEAARRIRSHGKQLWYYPCNWPFPPSANLLLENQATATRIMLGFMPWKYQSDGFLYYATHVLGYYASTRSLLGSWEKKGNVLIPQEGLNGYDGEYVLQTSQSDKSSSIARWTNVPKDWEKPIILEFEAYREGADSADDNAVHSELRLNYHDQIKTDNHYIAIGANNGQWKKYKIAVKPKAPIRNMLLAFRINTTDAEMRVRNIDLYQEGVFYEKRLTASRLMTEGPVFGPEFCYSVFRSNGDGTLVYPGPKGAIPSLRLKLIRDGLEDYEYLVLLRNAIQQIKAGKANVPAKDRWLMEAEKTLRVDDSICRDLAQYTNDGKELLRYRKRIAEMLEQVEKAIDR